jgi:phasin family protein
MLKEVPEMMTQKPRGRMPLHKASATKVAAGGSVGKVIPSGAEPVVSVIDAISETRQKPKTNMQVQEASATQAVMRDAIEKMAPAAAGPVVSVIDAISDTTQQIKASAPVQETLAAKGGREAVEQVTPAAGEPVVSKTQAISETLVASPAAVTEEMVKPVAAIKSTNPNSTLGMKTRIKSTDDLVAFGHANVEAFARSGQIWAAGVQELTKLFAATTKASFDESVSAFKAITSAKSVTEAINLQSAFASSAVAKTLAESNKLVDASIKLTEQTLAPITARVTGAVAAFGKAA